METEQPLLCQPFADIPALDELRAELFVNVPYPERIGSIVGWIAVIAAGVSRLSIAGAIWAAAGAALAFRGISGHCPVYEVSGKHPEARAPREVAV